MKLYRFEKNTNKRLQTILNGEIYLSRPEDFNDLEDCRIKAIFTPNFDENIYNKTQACLEIFYATASSDDFPLPIEILVKLREFISYARPYKKDLSDHLRAVLAKQPIVNNIRNHLRKTTGICCFFKGAPIHPLMWAHYANNHTGFCIEYEIDDSEGHSFIDVNYSTKAITPSINELLFCPNETLENILTTKSIEWNYEKETRLIFLNEFKNEEKGKNISLPAEMKPTRLIKGEKFNQSLNSQLTQELSIPIISYKDFIKEQDDDI